MNSTAASISESPWAYWQAVMAGKEMPVHEGQPQIGYYRTKGGKGRVPEPVAIFEHEGAIVALKSNNPVDANEVWTWVCTSPISYETYCAVAERGEKWPDLDEAVAAQIGHNNPPNDEAEMLREQVEAAKAGAAEYTKIHDDEMAARAQSLRARLLELKATIEKAHKAAKEPHLKAGRDVDAKWLPVAREAEGAANGVRTALTAFENEKMRAAREAQQKAEAEARRAAEAGRPVPVAPPVEAAPAAPIKGAYGKAASVRTIKVATVTDQDALYIALRDNPDVKALLQKLAQKVVDAGATPPGVSIDEQRKVA